MASADRATDPSVAEPEGLGDWLDAARRAVRWTKLFTLSRLDLVARLVEASGDQVDLFTPLLVDLDTGVADNADTTIGEQVIVYERISRASMLGLLPGAGRARVHPFIGFDPLRELAARELHPVETPFEIVQKAVLRSGFVGIKVYPQMGWMPSGNTTRTDLSPADASELDQIVADLVTWCEEHDVPITAHCGFSNYASGTFKAGQFGAPGQWFPLLDAHPGLHLNLGHFGGAHVSEPSDGWPWQIARAAARYPHLHADVGNHRIDDRKLADAYFAMLAQMWDGPDTAPMQQRLMYGSDWFMEAMHPHAEDFLSTYRTRYRQAFPAAVDGFMGANALTFLGFDDPANANAQRLLARYEACAPDRVPGWLAQ